MTEKRRPPSLHRPVTTQPGTRTITITLIDKRQLTLTPSSERAIAVLDEMTASLNAGSTITFNDPDGPKTVINSAHVLTLELR